MVSTPQDSDEEAEPERQTILSLGESSPAKSVPLDASAVVRMGVMKVRSSKGVVKPNKAVLELLESGVLSVKRGKKVVLIKPGELVAISLIGSLHASLFALTTNAGKTMTFLCPVDEIRLWMQELRRFDAKVGSLIFFFCFF
jgi:hypothetical protein